MRPTRGSVLVEMGEYTAGMALLKSATTESTDPTIDLPLINLFLARAENALGNRAAAHAHLGQARSAIDHETRLEWVRPLSERVGQELSKTMANTVEAEV